MMQSLFPSSSDYTRLASSPTKKQLLRHDSLNEFNRYEQYESTIKDLLRKNKANEEKLTELERKTERLDDLLFSKITVMERNGRENATSVLKLTELEQKMERFSHRLLSKKTEAQGRGKECIATENKVTELEQKIGHLEHLLNSKSAELERSIKKNKTNEKKVSELELKIRSVERLLLSKTAVIDGSISELQIQVHGPVLPPLIPNGTHEVNLVEHEDEPEYVNRLMGVILMLVFLLFVSIGMRL